MRTVAVPVMAPADAQTLEAAILAAVTGLKVKGRPVATYLQIVRSDAVADYMEGRMKLVPVSATLDELVNRGVLTRELAGWSMAERELIAKT